MECEPLAGVYLGSLDLFSPLRAMAVPSTVVAACAGLAPDQIRALADVLTILANSRGSAAAGSRGASAPAVAAGAGGAQAPVGRRGGRGSNAEFQSPNWGDDPLDGEAAVAESAQAPAQEVALSLSPEGFEVQVYGDTADVPTNGSGAVLVYPTHSVRVREAVAARHLSVCLCVSEAPSRLLL